MTDKSKKTLGWVALVGPIVAVTSLFLANGFCVPPWDTMSKAEAASQHTTILMRLDTHRDRVEAKLDSMAEDLHEVMGALKIRRK